MFLLFDLSHSDYIVSLNWILHFSHMKFTFFDLLFNLFLYHYCYYLFTLFLCNRREWKEILRKLLIRLLGYWVTKNIVSHILNLKEIKLKGKSEFLIWAVFNVLFMFIVEHFVLIVGIDKLVSFWNWSKLNKTYQELDIITFEYCQLILNPIYGRSKNIKHNILILLPLMQRDFLKFIDEDS